MNSIINYFTGLYKGVKSLVIGMKVTGYYFFHPSEIVTQQYPENRIGKNTRTRKKLEMFERCKGEVIMFRLYYNIFWGKQTVYHTTPHEAPATMTLPLIFLAIASATTGFIPFSKFVTSDGLPFETITEWGIAIPSVLIALVGITIATILYYKPTGIPSKMTHDLRNYRFIIF